MGGQHKVDLHRLQSQREQEAKKMSDDHGSVYNEFKGVLPRLFQDIIVYGTQNISLANNTTLCIKTEYGSIQWTYDWLDETYHRDLLVYSIDPTDTEPSVRMDRYVE